MNHSRAVRSALKTASLITAVTVFLLLSRSEIRKTVFPNLGAMLGVAAAVWIGVFLWTWRRRSADRRGL